MEGVRRAYAEDSAKSALGGEPVAGGGGGWAEVRAPGRRDGVSGVPNVAGTVLFF